MKFFLQLFLWCLIGCISSELISIEVPEISSVTFSDPTIICTCDKLDNKNQEEPVKDPEEPTTCDIRKIVFYFMWIEDDFGMHQDQMHASTNKMAQLFSHFLGELYYELGDDYDIEIRNIRKDKYSDNSYIVWKTFKLDADAKRKLMNNDSRPGTENFFSAFSVLEEDLENNVVEYNHEGVRLNPIVFVVTIQDRLKVNVQGHQLQIYQEKLNNCAYKHKDSVMLVLDKAATYNADGTTVRFGTASKWAVAAGLQCALNDRRIQNDLLDDVYRNGVCEKNDILLYRKCPIFVNHQWQIQVTLIAREFKKNLKKEIPKQCPLKSGEGYQDDEATRKPTNHSAFSGQPLGILPLTQTVNPDQVCYMDLIIALDMGCMNFNEYTTGKPQSLVDYLIDQIEKQNLIQAENEFRVSLIGFSTNLVTTVSLSEFSFIKNRNKTYAKQRLLKGLNDIKLLLGSRSNPSSTDFTRSLQKLGEHFDSRSFKNRQLLIITNAQNMNNYLTGKGRWMKRELELLNDILLTQLQQNGGPDETHITAVAVNPPCKQISYPEDCSFPDILRKMDPSYNNRILDDMNRNQIKQFAADFIGNLADDIKGTQTCFRKPKTLAPCACTGGMDLCVTKTDFSDGIPIIEGPAGNVGRQGLQGFPGLPGRVGPSGPPGMPGVAGPRGKAGRPGLPGPRPPHGRSGPPGDDGDEGTKGHRGRPGRPSSMRGLPGVPGEDGVSGEDGSKGYRGRQGIEGMQGENGECGPEGVAGPPGQKGRDIVSKNVWGETIIYEDVRSDIENRLSKVFNNNFATSRTELTKSISAIAERMVGQANSGRSFCDCIDCSPPEPTVSPNVTTTVSVPDTTPDPGTGTIDPTCNCLRQTKTKDLTIFFDNSDSVTSLGLDQYNAIIDSIARIAETWAHDDERDPNVDSLIIVAKFSSRIQTPILRQTAAEFRRKGPNGLKAELTDIVNTRWGPQVQISDALNLPWSAWETNYGTSRSGIAGTTFFYTTLTDLVNYVETGGYFDRRWINDNNENWLIIITDGSKFDDDPWPLQSESTPNKDDQLAEKTVCETFNSLKRIYKKRYVFGTSPNIQSKSGIIQQNKFQSIIANEHNRCKNSDDDIFKYEGSIDGWVDFTKRAGQAQTVNDLLCCKILDVKIRQPSGILMHVKTNFLEMIPADVESGCYSYRSGTGDVLSVTKHGWQLNDYSALLVAADQQDLCCPKKNHGDWLRFPGRSLGYQFDYVDEVVLSCAKIEPPIEGDVQVDDSLCADIVYVTDSSNVDQAALIGADANKFHNSKNCRAGLVLSGFNKPLIDLIPIQDFYDQFQAMTANMRARPFSQRVASNYQDDLSLAHQMFRDVGYNNDNQLNGNVPFIKMFIHEDMRGKRDNQARSSQRRRVSFEPYYTKVFVFTNKITYEIRDIVSQPETEYLYVAGWPEQEKNLPQSIRVMNQFAGRCQVSTTTDEYSSISTLTPKPDTTTVEDKNTTTTAQTATTILETTTVECTTVEATTLRTTFESTIHTTAEATTIRTTAVATTISTTEETVPHRTLPEKGSNCVDMIFIVDASLKKYIYNIKWVILDAVRRYYDPVTHYSRVRLLFASDAVEYNVIDPDGWNSKTPWKDLFEFSDMIAKEYFLEKSIANLGTAHINLDAALRYANHELRNVYEQPRNKPIVMVFADRPNHIYDAGYSVENIYARHEYEYFLMTSTSTAFLDNVTKYEGPDHRIILENWNQVQTQEDMSKFVRLVNAETQQFKCMSLPTTTTSSTTATTTAVRTTEILTTTAETTLTTTTTTTTTTSTTTAETTLTTTTTTTTTTSTTTTALHCEDYKLPNDLANVIVLTDKKNYSKQLESIERCLKEQYPGLETVDPNVATNCNIENMRNNPAGCYPPGSSVNNEYLVVHLTTNDCKFGSSPCLDNEVHETLNLKEPFLVTEVWGDSPDKLSSDLNQQSKKLNRIRADVPKTSSDNRFLDVAVIFPSALTKNQVKHFNDIFGSIVFPSKEEPLTIDAIYREQGNVLNRAVPKPCFGKACPQILTDAMKEIGTLPKARRKRTLQESSYQSVFDRLGIVRSPCSWYGPSVIIDFQSNFKNENLFGEPELQCSVIPGDSNEPRVSGYGLAITNFKDSSLSVLYVKYMNSRTFVLGGHEIPDILGENINCPVAKNHDYSYILDSTLGQSHLSSLFVEQFEEYLRPFVEDNDNEWYNRNSVGKFKPKTLYLDTQNIDISSCPSTSFCSIDQVQAKVKNIQYLGLGGETSSLLTMRTIAAVDKYLQNAAPQDYDRVGIFMIIGRERFNISQFMDASGNPQLYPALGQLKYSHSVVQYPEEKKAPKRAHILDFENNGDVGDKNYPKGVILIDVNVFNYPNEVMKLVSKLHCENSPSINCSQDPTNQACQPGGSTKRKRHTNASHRRHKH